MSWNYEGKNIELFSIEIVTLSMIIISLKDTSLDSLFTMFTI